MLIDDIVYGQVEITEPVLIDLINCDAVQRLKHINQAGASKYIMPKNSTRYDHSIGVMILLKRLGASVEEQIAGLLHDVPHTAFSHVVDFVFKTCKLDFKDTKMNYHEKHHERIVMDSEIPNILKKHSIDIDFILDENNFPLLEKKLPDLCADRVDYTLRDMLTYSNMKKEVEEHLKHIIVDNDMINFDSKENALKFAEDFLMMDTKIWADVLEVTSFQILADAIKIGLDESILTEDDLFDVDDRVYEKLKNSGNEKIREKLKKLNPRLKIKLDNYDYDFFTATKCRFVDPIIDGKRLSEHFPELKKKIEEHKKFVSDGYHVKIVGF